MGETKQKRSPTPAKMLRSLSSKIVIEFKSMLQHSHLVSTDSQSIAQAQLDAYIEAQSQEIAPEIEIDSTSDDDFGTLYRVWHGSNLLGTFYHAVDGESSAVLGSQCEGEVRRLSEQYKIQVQVSVSDIRGSVSGDRQPQVKPKNETGFIHAVAGVAAESLITEGQRQRLWAIASCCHEKQSPPH